MLNARDSYRISVGVLLYRSSTYLPAFLRSLQLQNLPFELLVGDNNEDRNEAWWLQKNLPQAKVFHFGNIGFAKGHNRLLAASSADYYACLNPDLRLGERYLERLAQVLESDAGIGAVQGSILRLDGRSIDSLGLHMKPWGQVVNLDEGISLERSRSSISGRVSIWGVTGAAALYRKSAFLQAGGFDERMFMYKEDVDLAFRLRMAGYQSALVPGAVAYHHRGVRSGARRQRSLRERRWSYHNHRLFIANMWKTLPWWRKLMVGGYEGLKRTYILFFERDLTRGDSHGSFD